MFRKNFIGLLQDRPMTLNQIARLVDEKPKDIEDDLHHLLKSLKHTEYVAVVTPAQCRKCNFEFSVDKLTKPSKCPECRATWLTEPMIEIRQKEEPENTKPQNPNTK